MFQISRENISKVDSVKFASHIPPSPPLLEARIMTTNKALHLREWRAIGSGIDRAHQQTRDIDRPGPEMTLQTVRRPRELRSIRRLFQCIEYGPSPGVHCSQSDH